MTTLKIETVFKPVFWILLDAKQIELLFQMSALHYDGVCKSATQVGGFIYGWRNSVSFDPSVKCRAEFKEMDTVLKICENSSFLLAQEKALVRSIRDDIRDALQISDNVGSSIHIQNWRDE